MTLTLVVAEAFVHLKCIGDTFRKIGLRLLFFGAYIHTEHTRAIRRRVLNCCTFTRFPRQIRLTEQGRAINDTQMQPCKLMHAQTQQVQCGNIPALCESMNAKRELANSARSSSSSWSPKVHFLKGPMRSFSFFKVRRESPPQERNPA